MRWASVTPPANVRSSKATPLRLRLELALGWPVQLDNGRHGPAYPHLPRKAHAFLQLDRAGLALTSIW